MAVSADSRCVALAVVHDRQINPQSLSKGCLTHRGGAFIVQRSLKTWGRTGFDEDVDVRIARRGAQGHVKMGNKAKANDNGADAALAAA